LLENQAEIDARDFEGRTPLMYASHSVNCDVTGLLLRHNADATLTDLQGMTSLHFLAISASRFEEDLVTKLMTSLVESMPKNLIKCFVNKREHISGSTGEV
jgi:ankyrin repeat protein